MAWMTDYLCVRCGDEFKSARKFGEHRRQCKLPYDLELIFRYGKVAVDALTGCMIWNRDDPSRSSYGKCDTHGAHQLVYATAFGIDVESLVGKETSICHTCDRPGCVNPEHLWLGTHADNIRDAYAKGRRVAPSLLPGVAEKISTGRKANPIDQAGDKNWSRRNPERAAENARRMREARFAKGQVSRVG